MNVHIFSLVNANQILRLKIKKKSSILRILKRRFIFRLVDPEGQIAVIIDSAFRSSDHFIDYMSNQNNVFLDLHHYQGFGAYWNNLALETPNGWITHYKHSCKVIHNL